MQFVIVTRSAAEMARASTIMRMLVRDPDLVIGPQLPLVSRPTKSERAPVDFGPVQLRMAPRWVEVRSNTGCLECSGLGDLLGRRAHEGCVTRGSEPPDSAPPRCWW